MIATHTAAASLTDAHALLRAILADPQDDAPRLIYADWLEEHGQGERAEFIRVQVELAKRNRRLHDTGHPAFGKRWLCNCGNGQPCGPCIELQAREITLFKDNLCRWMHGNVTPNAAYRIEGESAPKESIAMFFARGFVSSIRLTMADFMRHAKAIFATQPVTTVDLSCRQPHRGRFDPNADTEHRGKEFWIWDLQPERVMASNLIPWEIYQHIDKPLNPWHCQFLTESAARDALSAACVAYGRRAAGLGELE